MSEANLTGGGGGGVPIGGTHFFPNAFPVDFVSKANRFLRTGNVETDPAKFDGTIWAESVGADWTRAASIGTQYSDSPYDVQSSGNLLIMTESPISGVQPRILRSTDNGASWAERVVTEAAMSSGCFNALDYGAGKFVLVGTGGLICTTTDGLTFTKQNSTVAATLNDVKWNGSMFVAVGAGVILTSADGVTWLARAVPTALAGQNFYSVEYGNNTWVAVGAAGVCVTAPADGATWTARPIAGATYSVNAVYFDTDANKFYAGGGGIALSSSDGLNWLLLTQSFGPAYGGGMGFRFAKHNGYFYFTSGGVVIRTKDFTNASYIYPRPSLGNFKFCKKLRNGSLVALDGSTSSSINYFKANLAPFAGHPVQIVHDNYAVDSSQKLIAYVRIS